MTLGQKIDEIKKEKEKSFNRTFSEIYKDIFSDYSDIIIDYANNGIAICPLFFCEKNLLFGHRLEDFEKFVRIWAKEEELTVSIDHEFEYDPSFPFWRRKRILPNSKHLIIRVYL